MMLSKHFDEGSLAPRSVIDDTEVAFFLVSGLLLRFFSYENSSVIERLVVFRPHTASARVHCYFNLSALELERLFCGAPVDIALDMEWRGILFHKLTT